jgi:putative ABC transport system permease protein
MSARVPLAWLMLVKLKGRFVTAIAGIAVSVILALVQLGFQGALYASITRLYSSMVADLVLISPQYQSILARETFPERRLYQTLAISQVDSVASIYIDTAEWINPVNQRERFILVVGFKPRPGVINLPGVDDSIALARIAQPGEILYDEASRSEFGPIGALLRRNGTVSVDLSHRRVEVAGLFRLGASFANNGHVITSDTNFLQLVPTRARGDIDVGLIRLRPGSDGEHVRAALSAILPNDVEVLTRQGFLDRERNYWSSNLPIGFFFRASLAMGLIVGAVVVYQVLYSGISEHLAEFATLKAVGYSHNRLFRVVLEQALILSILGFIPGLLLGTAVYRIVQAATFLPIRMTMARMILVFLLTIIMCTAAGALAMRRLHSADPAEVF